ncbi:MAG: D-aminoacyl-tRNA deacylase [Phycisphaerales bacterium]|nr:D-aminoacyl-tRNA deacylase [Phycisphaerales bacterium]
MIAVVQRVSSATVLAAEVNHEASIGAGLVALLCVETGDTEEDARWMSGKLARLRVFADDEGKFNRSIQDLNGKIMLVSQFTLAGNCSKGNRPSFITAADPELGKSMCELVEHELESTHQVQVETGVFQTTMELTLVNEGPATFIIQR